MGKTTSKTIPQIDPTNKAEFVEQCGSYKVYRNKAGI